MSKKRLSSIGLIMPDDFPSDLYDDVNHRISKNRDDYLSSWYQFAGGWNAIAYRFLSCTDSNDDFILSISKHGNSPAQPERYNQEKLLFNFFVTGLSALQSLSYALYFACSILDKINFPVSSKKDLKSITIESTQIKLEQSALQNKESIIKNLKDSINSAEYKDWKEKRNILAHRSAPGRNIFEGGNEHGKVKWMNGLEIDKNTTAQKYEWLLANVKKLIEEVSSFVNHNFKQN